MRLFLIGLLTIAVSLVIQYWQKIQFERAKRELLRLRDDLRAKAIADRQFRNGKIFNLLDGLIGTLFQDFDQISLWSILPFIRAAPRAGAELDALIQDSKYASAMMASLGKVLLRVLGARHFIVLGVLAVSIVGLIPLLALGKRGMLALNWFVMSEASKSVQSKHPCRLVRSG